MKNISHDGFSLYKKDSALNQKSFSFAVRIVEMVKYMRKNCYEPALCNQVLRSGTAIGALIMESEYAQSKADFINKLGVALKEANETRYWLALLCETGYLEERQHESMMIDCSELLAMLVASVKTAKNIGIKEKEYH